MNICADPCTQVVMQTLVYFLSLSLFKCRKVGQQWNIPYSVSQPRDDFDRGNLTSVAVNDKLNFFGAELTLYHNFSILCNLLNPSFHLYHTVSVYKKFI